MSRTFRTPRRRDARLEGFLETTDEELSEISKRRHRKTIKRGGWIFGTVCLSFIYLLFSSPGKVVVNQSAEVSGLLNRLRAGLQGKRFWNDQLSCGEAEIKVLQAFPALMEETQKGLDQTKKEIDQIVAKADRAMDEFYRTHPNVKPPAEPKQTEAAALRQRADDLDAAQVTQFLYEIRVQRIEELKSILPIIRLRTE